MTAEDFHKLADAAAPTSAQSLEARETRWKLFDAVFTERQRIHRALLLLEMVESDSNMRVDGMFTARRVVAADFLLERLDAASQEVGA